MDKIIKAKQSYYWERYTICKERGDEENAKKWLEKFEEIKE